MNSYSTNGEDTAIAAYFERIGLKEGLFLDIGASNGITLSNTHLLANQGWSGVCVDANAQELFNLITLYWGNPRIQIVQGCVIPVPRYSLKEFWNSKSANISTSCERMQKRGREREGARKTYIAPVELLHLFRAPFPPGYDFINIDLEGDTLDILFALPEEAVRRAHIICAEHLRADWYFGENEEQMIKDYGAKHGFEVLTRTDENVILVKPC